MIVYFLVIALVGACFTVRNSNLAIRKHTKEFWYFAAWMILLLVLALRYNVGTDYPHYARNYAYYVAMDIEYSDALGASLIAKIGALLWDDSAMWFFIMGILTVIPCALVIRRESISVCLSSMLYVILCCWHTSFNIVMQSAATSILLLGLPCLRERKFIKWCILCLIASVFHITAIVMIPVYFLVSPKVTWTRSFMLLGIGLTITFLYDQLFALMETISGKASETVDSTYGAEQLNLLRVLVNCAPTVLAVCLLKYLPLQDKKFCVLFNLSLFNAVLNVGTMNSAYLNRFAVYTIIFNALFIPYLAKPFKRKSRIMFWSALFILYGAFWAYDLYKCADTVQYYWIFQRS